MLETIMSDYKALARRWRPQSFHYFVGQQHAITALQQSLERQQVHHAHLLTGTRGVGKTSLARVLAKGLSCMTGITATPCEQCEHCKAIEAGNYIDLIEIDAASRTKVEDTKELLSQVHYPPVQGRFKIYLIDEVHSLSANSFNALLKTLEEPPEHIKFILATTDPQKLPVTIQSRCIQLHLQQLSQHDISKHLAKILADSQVPFSEEALLALAEAACGSMRDALSLLEQALALNQSHIDNQLVHDMLGRAPKADIVKLIQAIASNDKIEITTQLEKFEHNQLDYHTVLDQLISQLYEITSDQVLGTRSASLDQTTLTADQIQLYIQILVRAKSELDLYPDQTIGFNLTILRMMTFKLDQNNLTELISQQQVSIINTEEKPPKTATSPTKNPSTVLNSNSPSRTDSESQALKSSQATNTPNKLATKREHSVQTNRQDSTNDWHRISQSTQCRGMIAQIIDKSIPPSDLTTNHWDIQLCDTKLNNLATKAFEDKISALCLKVLSRTISVSLIPKPVVDNEKPQARQTEDKINRDTPANTTSKRMKAFAEALDAKPIESTSD
ncbi:MAG: DNA polymerase III, subunit gamma and tau [Legionellales bacterium]|nr:DNA polymerase III, subunit gamma and tau [Legionellales bacterium]|tara:strand:- start:1010 stop:2689 length:1680 start_codon:yes stop_codon:yes gene_type:complete